MRFLMVFIVFAVAKFSLAIESGNKQAILDRLLESYKNCERKSSAGEVYDCRNKAYQSETRNFCRNAIENCFRDAGDMQLMDPFRCFDPKKCEVTAGKAKLTYSYPGGKCKANTQRTELTDPYIVNNGSAAQFSMSVSFPKKEDLQVPSLLMAQFKASCGDSPPFALRMKDDGRLVATIRQNFDRGAEYCPENRGLASGEVVSRDKESPQGCQIEKTILSNVNEYEQRKGKPIAFVLQVLPGPKGYVRLSVDGQVLFSHDGPVGYPGTNELPHGPNYMKIGPYDHSCKQTQAISLTYGDYRHGPVTDKLPPAQFHTVESHGAVQPGATKIQ